MILQDDTGTVANANSYLSVAAFRSYWTARGVDTSASSDPVVEAALVNATTYLDGRFTYYGRKLFGRDQTTEWPRLNCYDRDRLYVNGIPQEVKNATAEYAKRSLAGALLPDPTYDATGQKVIEVTKKVDVIESTIKYAEGVSFSMPKYPTADNLLKRAGFVQMGGEMRRG